MVLIKEKPTNWWHARNSFCKQVVVEYLNVWFHILMKKEVLETFSFMCPVTALPVSYHRHLNLCIALSTWSPRFTNHSLYLRCQSLASPAKLFILIF